MIELWSDEAPLFVYRDGERVGVLVDDEGGFYAFPLGKAHAIVPKNGWTPEKFAEAVWGEGGTLAERNPTITGTTADGHDVAFYAPDEP